MPDSTPISVPEMAQGLAVEGLNAAQSALHALGYTSPELHRRLGTDDQSSLFLTTSGKLISDISDLPEGEKLVGTAEVSFVVSGVDSYVRIQVSPEYQIGQETRIGYLENEVP